MQRFPAPSSSASRRYPRARVDLSVEVSAKGADGSEAERATGRCVELSVGGMRMSAGSGDVARPGAAVRVLLEAGARRVDLDARVVWSSEDHRGRSVGLAFASEDQCSELPALVSQLRAEHSWNAL